MNYLLRPLASAVLALALMVSSALNAQSIFSGLSMEEVPIPEDIRLVIEQEAGFEGTARCWRLYACVDPNANASVNSIFGFEDTVQGIVAPWIVDCPDCTGPNKFYQSPVGGFIGPLINPVIFQVIPQAAYDSWFTLGEPPYPGNGVFYVENTNPDDVFEAGGAYIDDSEGGSAVFHIPDGNPVLAGLPGPDGRVLLGQFTTDGTVEGNLSIQLRFLDEFGFPISPPVTQDEYNLTFSSETSPVNCEGFDNAGCTDPNACNFDPNANINDNSCFYATAIYDCNGNCQSDVDGNGICDQLEDLIGPANCGPGTIWDATINQCIGFDDCPSDFNNDGIVDAGDLLTFLSAFGESCE